MRGTIELNGDTKWVVMGAIFFVLVGLAVALIVHEATVAFLPGTIRIDGDDLIDFAGVSLPALLLATAALVKVLKGETRQKQDRADIEETQIHTQDAHDRIDKEDRRICTEEAEIAGMNGEWLALTSRVDKLEKGNSHG